MSIAHPGTAHHDSVGAVFTDGGPGLLHYLVDRLEGEVHDAVLHGPNGSELVAHAHRVGEHFHQGYRFAPDSDDGELAREEGDGVQGGFAFPGNRNSSVPPSPHFPRDLQSTRSLPHRRPPSPPPWPCASYRAAQGPCRTTTRWSAVPTSSGRKLSSVSGAAALRYSSAHLSTSSGENNTGITTLIRISQPSPDRLDRPRLRRS